LRDLAAATPEHRDRYVDLLRAVSIVAVVLGHWTVAAVTVTDAGLTGVNLLDAAPWTHPLTWLFQVMPVFFLVGGYANTASLDAHRRRGGGSVAWVRQRALRLLRPTAALLAVLLGVKLVAIAVGGDARQVQAAVWFATEPLWFVVVYLAVVLLAPVAVGAYRRWGIATVGALVACVLAGDVARLATGEVAPAAANYVFGWLAVHQAGIAWRDGDLPRTARGAWVMAGGGLGAALLLTGPGPYGVAMVGAATPPSLSNTAPPTIALLALATAQTALVLLLRRPVSAWLARARVWTAVVGVNAVILTVFLWHMTALVIGGFALVSTGVLPEQPIGSAGWFWLRIPWLVVLGAVLVVLVVVMRRWEAPVRPDPLERPSAVLVGLGVVAVLAGMASLGVSEARGLAPQVAGIPVVEVGMIAAGLMLIARPGRTEPAPGQDVAPSR
jgi:hypothetical protein